MKFKFTILFVVLIGGLSDFSYAQTQVVPQSGINWRESTLTLNRFQPANPRHRESFNCFQQTYDQLPIQTSLFDLGYDNSDSGPLTLNQALEKNACFQQAGWYDLSLNIFDYAGNSSQFDQVLTITPANLSLSDSTIDTVASQTTGGQRANLDIAERAACASLSLVADGKDACLLEVNLRDRFGNVIRPEALEGIVSLALPTDEASARLDASRDLYGAFLGGLYFDEAQKRVDFQLPQEDNQLQVGLSAFVPSLVINDEEAGVSQAIVPATQPVNIELSYNSAAEGVPTITTNKTVNPRFSPWIQIMADVQESTAENFALLPLNRAVKIPFLISGAFEKELPRRLIIDWVAPDLESLNLRFEANNDNPKTLRDILSIEASPHPYNLEVSLIQPDSVVNDTDFRIQPIISYLTQVNGEDEIVRYPMSIIQDKALSLLPAFKPSLLKFIIEDQQNQRVDDETAINVVLADRDKILYSDWRRRASRNVISLVRGIPASNETEFNINQGFGNQNIAYFKGVDLKLTGDGDSEDPLLFAGGAKTLIVEDGNLVLDRDLLYKSEEDSLGIIVINTRAGDPERGNVYVGDTVQKIVGNYFLDGSFVSTTDVDTASVYDIIEDRETTPNQNLRAPLARQLILEGALMARNTIGGADLERPIGPSGARVTRSLALIYDLNYMRRYEPLFDIDGVRVRDEENNFCYKPVSGKCYPNPAPFVIQQDERLENLPPPGFEPDE